MLLHLGVAVTCTDGQSGELADIIIDPDTRRVTHIVVAFPHHHDEARLVPVDLIISDDSSEQTIKLRCTATDIQALAAVQESAYVRMGEVPSLDGDADQVGIEDVVTVPTPQYGSFEMYPAGYDTHVVVTYDRVPKGDVEVRKDSDIWSADGERIGHLDGVVVDDHATITQLVLERGHLWGRHRITIPSRAIAKFSMDGVTLALSKTEAESLLPTR